MDVDQELPPVLDMHVALQIALLGCKAGMGQLVGAPEDLQQGLRTLRGTATLQSEKSKVLAQRTCPIGGTPAL